MQTHLFFDLDKTLWDFEANSRQTLLEIYHYFKLESIIPDSSSFIEAYETHNEQCWAAYQRNEMRKDFLRHQRFFLTLEQFGFKNRTLSKKLANEYVTLSPLKTQLRPFAMELIQELNGEFPLHIITNGFQEVQSIKLKASGLEPYFQQIITSEKAGHKKPSPRIFQHALKRAGAQAEYSWMLGDDWQADVQGALNSGLKSIWYNPNNEPMPATDAWQVNCLSKAAKIIRAEQRQNSH